VITADQLVCHAVQPLIPREFGRVVDGRADGRHVRARIIDRGWVQLTVWQGPHAHYECRGAMVVSVRKLLMAMHRRLADPGSRVLRRLRGKRAA